MFSSSFIGGNDFGADWWQLPCANEVDVVLLEWIFLNVLFAFTGKMTLMPIHDDATCEWRECLIHWCSMALNTWILSNTDKICHCVGKYNGKEAILSEYYWTFVFFNHGAYVSLTLSTSSMKEINLDFDILLTVMWMNKVLKWRTGIPSRRRSWSSCIMARWLCLTMIVTNVVIKHRNTVIIVLNHLIMNRNKWLELIDKRLKRLGW
jgi:hypothetical protein